MSIKDRTTHAMVMLPANMINEIDEYKDDNNIRTRNETIRTLIQKGLDSTQDS